MSGMGDKDAPTHELAPARKTMIIPSCVSYSQMTFSQVGTGGLGRIIILRIRIHLSLQAAQIRLNLVWGESVSSSGRYTKGV